MVTSITCHDIFQYNIVCQFNCLLKLESNCCQCGILQVLEYNVLYSLLILLQLYLGFHALRVIRDKKAYNAWDLYIFYIWLFRTLNRFAVCLIPIIEIGFSVGIYCQYALYSAPYCCLFSYFFLILKYAMLEYVKQKCMTLEKIKRSIFACKNQSKWYTVALII